MSKEELPKGIKYHFNTGPQKMEFFDYAKHQETVEKKRKRDEEVFEQEVRGRIDHIKKGQFNVLRDNPERLAAHLEGLTYMEQKAILEKASEEGWIDLGSLVALYNLGKNGQLKTAAIENIPNISNLSPEESRQAVDFLSSIKFNPDDESMQFNEDFFFSPRDEFGARYLSRYYNYHYETADNEGKNIIDGARVSSLLKFGAEGESKVLDILDEVLFKKDQMEYEDPLASYYLLRELSKYNGDDTHKFILKKLIENDFPGWEYRDRFIKFLKKNREKSQKIILNSIPDRENKEKMIQNFSIAAAEVLGTEEFRDKINALIIEKRLQNEDEATSRLEYVLSWITPYLKPAKINEETGEIESDEEKDEKKIENIKNLKEFYQEHIKFEEYKVNSAMNEREVSLLKSLVGKDGKTLEMGCGTGRLIKELAKEGHDVSGYDFTERHVEITKSEIEKEGGEAKVFQGDWHENAVKDESLDTVYSLGRNILHDYSIADQAQLFREAARILKKGGKFIFDIPDREKGGYAQMVKGYAEEMEKRGIRNFRFGSIYDSPDGTHFATRYAYSQEDIEELARLSGFKITDIKRLPLETGQGDENLYYVLEKI